MSLTRDEFPPDTPLHRRFLTFSLFSRWLPTIVASFGFTTTASSQLLNIPPAAVGIIVSLGAAYAIDHSFQIPRPVYLLVSKALCIGAFIGLTVVTSKVRFLSLRH
jgi:hypothetical protein